MTIRKWIIGMAAVLAIVMGGGLLFLHSIQMFATAPVYQTSNGALDGYDPVAYFTEGQPRQGRGDMTARWNGAVWRFATAENRAAFLRSPDRYAPQYGGYCAYAVASGYTAKTDPDAWKIVGERLYLNFDAATAAKWSADGENFIEQGDANWPRVIQD